MAREVKDVGKGCVGVREVKKKKTMDCPKYICLRRMNRWMDR